MIEIPWMQAKYHWRRFVTWTRDTIDSEIEALLGAYGSTCQIRFRRALSSYMQNILKLESVSDGLHVVKFIVVNPMHATLVNVDQLRVSVLPPYIAY
jgi:hypothetical protein